MTGNDTIAKVGDSSVLVCSVIGTLSGTDATYQWTRADMSSLSGNFSENIPMYYLPHVGVSDAGVYICAVNITDSSNTTSVFSMTGSVNVTLTVTSKLI